MANPERLAGDTAGAGGGDLNIGASHKSIPADFFLHPQIFSFSRRFFLLPQIFSSPADYADFRRSLSDDEIEICGNLRNLREKEKICGNLRNLREKKNLR